MRVLLLLMGLVVLASLVVLWRAGGRASVEVGGPMPVEARPERAQEPLVPAARRAEAGPEPRERAREESSVTPDPASAPESAPAPTGLVVRGVVRFSSDRQPAAHARFALHHATGYVLVETDEEGRFVTPPEVAPGILRPWHMLTPGDRRLGLRLRFEPENLAFDAVVARSEVELVLRDPDHRLEVQVVTRDGQPAPGTEVRLHTWSDEDAGPGHRVDSARTDERGRAALPLYDLQGLDGVELLAVDAGRALVSDRLALAPPLSESEQLLVLDVAGRLLVRVLDAAGAPVPGQGVWFASMDSAAGPVGASRETDARGEAHLFPLPPGAYEVGLVGSPGVQARVDVQRGVEHEVELEVPRALTALAAAGVVVDEEGRPVEGVEIHARTGPGRSDWLTTDAEGRFEFRSEPVPTVWLSSDEDAFGDVYDPPSQEVLFGTPDVVFRRRQTLPRLTLSLEVVDSAGEPLPGVLVLGYRESHPGMYSFHRGEAGLVSLPVTLHPESRLAVDAAGHRRVRLDVNRLLEDHPEGGVHRIALEPGLRAAVFVVDDDSEAPLPGVRILRAGAVAGVTGPDGRAELDLHGAVETLTFVAEGRASQVVDPAEWIADLEAAQVRLARSGDR